MEAPKRKPEYHEVLEEFLQSPLNDEFKAMITGRLSATMHAMHRAVHEPDKLKVVDTHGDFWMEGFNEFVMLYQKYHDPKV